jgi:hypothetical protein
VGPNQPFVVSSDWSEQMSVKNSSGTVLLRESTLLPPGFTLETEAFLPGWTIVSALDAHALGRKLEEARWQFFYLASETKTNVLGREKPEALRRAVKHILAKRKGQKCNSLEITSVASKSFLGVPFLSVAVNFRHIQEGIYLIPGMETVARTPGTAASGIEQESKERLTLVETPTKHRATQALGH